MGGQGLARSGSLELVLRNVLVLRLAVLVLSVFNSTAYPCERSPQPLAQGGLDVPKQNKNVGSCSNASQLQ